MHKLIVLAAVVAVAVAAGAHITDESLAFIDGQSLPWKGSADQGPLISGASKQDIKNLCGARKDVKRPAGRVFSAEELALEIPTEFDSATKWPECPSITNIRDQSACGSCWAFGAAESMSDRYCTYGGPKNVEISAATLMECCSFCGQGCHGGQPALAWDFWVSYGLYDNQCQPYPFPKCSHHVKGNLPPCPKAIYPTPQCQANSCTTQNGTTKVWKGNHSFSLEGEQQYQREILLHGPIEVAFSVYSDFPAYKSGVYTKSPNAEYLGGHAVRAVGWGVLNGVPYWKIANSWNSGWGNNGYFYIRRGVDECGIETSGVAGSPKLE